MSIYQAGYYRKGRQGANSGWSVVSPSLDMGKTSIDGYSGIASYLVEIGGNNKMPVINRGVYSHDLYMYMLQINYNAKGLDSRGVSYVHTYCVDKDDFYELMKQPERVLGIKNSTFPLEYNDSVQNFPEVDTVEYDDFDFVALLQKYGIGDEEYRKLVLGAICAMEGFSNTMCIKYTAPLEEYEQISREITYLIMMGIPAHLRIKMTYFSYKDPHATIYFSDSVQGDNYVDLDTMEFVCDIARLGNYEFTRIYNSFPAVDYQKRGIVLQAIDEFIDKVIDNPLREVGVAQIEAGFQKKIKKNEDGIDSEKAYGLLADFMEMNFNNDPEVFEYLADLLQLINDYSIEVEDSDIRYNLRKLYDNTDNLHFKKQLCILTMTEIMNTSQEKGYKLLNHLYASSPNQYEMLCSIMAENQREYYREYYLTSFLPSILTDFGKIETFINQNPAMEDDVRFTLIKIIRTVAVKKIKTNAGFTQNHADSTYAFDLVKKIGTEPKFKDEARIVIRELFGTVWNCFNMSEFDPEDEKLYKACFLEKLADSSGGVKGNFNALRVLMLCSLFTREVTKDTVKTLRTVLFTNDILENIADKERIQSLLSEGRYYERTVTELNGFDVFLMLFYRVKDGTFQVNKWARKLSEIVGNEDFEPRFVSNVVNHSLLLNKDSVRESFANSLEAAIKNEKGSSNGKLTREEIRGCQKYLDGLCGKEIKDDYQMDEDLNYLNVLHRAFIGFFALVTIGTGLFSLKNYVAETQSSVWAWVAFGVTVTMIIVGLVGKFFLSEGLDGMIAESGMSNSMMKFVIYIIVIVAMIIMAALFYFLARTSFTGKMVGLIIYMVLAVTSSIVYSLVAEE